MSQVPDSFSKLIEQAQSKTPRAVCAVVHPCDEISLGCALDAAKMGLFVPLLVGPKARIEAVAAEHGFDLTGVEIVNTPHSHASAEQAVLKVLRGEAQSLMKGSLHTDELMHAVMTVEGAGLRTERRLSHIFLMDVPRYEGLLFITDAGININPNLAAKADIIQNVADLHVGLGFGVPRVAVLSAVETVTEKIPSTLDAAALCKMADRGQITNVIIDGPLAMDNAINIEAARIKGITSEVAGRAQVLVAPDLESGNMLAKNLTFLSGAQAAGIVLGAKVPIILTSRADSHGARLASCAVAAVYADVLVKKNAASALAAGEIS